MKCFKFLILCLLATSLVSAKDLSKENVFPVNNKKSCSSIDGSFKKFLETGFIYTYIGSDGCTYTISVDLNVNEQNGHVDYTQIYMESGCGHGDIFTFYGWSNYIDSNITNTHLKAKTLEGQKIADNPNFIQQFNKEVEAHIN